MKYDVYKDIPYGKDQRHKLDAYICKDAPKPTPGLIFLHGGGYVGGDKSHFEDNHLMKECLQEGISVFTANYRFIDSDPFPAPMHDGTRVIQFVKSQARQWNIDPNKIVTSGTSAGGHIALWNALRGDLANPESDDPIERISSDVKAFVGFETQISKDERFYTDIYSGPHTQPNIALFYGLDSDEQLMETENLKLAEKASAINYFSPTVPPVFMQYDGLFEGMKIPEDATVNEVIHHPIHGYILQEKYEEYNIPFIFRHAGNPVKPKEAIAFIKKHIHGE